MYNWYDTWGPSSNDPGLIDTYGTGEPTNQYYYAQDLNPEIMNLGTVIKRLISTDIFHAGPNNPWPNHCTEFSYCSDMNSFDANSSEWTLGFFEDIRGEEYFMIVNNTHAKDTNSIDLERTCTVTFDSSINSLKKMDRETGEVSTINLSNNTLTLTLPGGTGDLFKYDTGESFTKTLCGENGYLDEDLNRDCIIDINDVKELYELWSNCTNFESPDCLNYYDCNSEPDNCKWTEQQWRLTNFKTRDPVD